ncbi:FAD-dependent oxidoreductase [Leptothoe spongobia]|uniref:NAD(P)/FAD-dependent oxidoreductase n=1 Tax=Leptothoe spongobia TAU-MAC 1115 TaxID=1967444 RepID=A0A947DAQ1_9CYAN|nr:FAD-dependent oxidoreductase [Leptothoe spongobia]MBT9313936.1 NAD(P)/FAD-dependent oxidoreductase [Leptothoe spongobia TAU-MAC 1115]
MPDHSTDYDLAILGGSIGSRLAAYTAVRRGARVALISQAWRDNDVTRHLWHALHSANLKEDLGTWPTLRDWVGFQCEHTELSPTILRTQGIDVILEPARFIGNLKLKLASRYLKASRYLLTDGYGMSTSGMLQNNWLCHRLMQLDAIPQRIALVGHGAMAVEWAYALSRFATVTLILLEQVLLPAEDHDIQRLVSAQLKSLSINIVHTKECLRDGVIPNDDADLFVVVPQPFAWETLGLENLGIMTGKPIATNRYLQTNCSQIYVSGGSLGGENRTELTQQETMIALENALFGRRHAMDYRQAFYGINLLSPIGHWGLTERQAKEHYGAAAVEVVQASCLPEMAKHPAQTNFCKLITHGSRIVGVHLMGEEAATVVATLGNQPTMGTLSRQIARVIPGTLFDAIYQAADQWKSRHWNEGQWRRDWAENWFNLRRSI